MKRSYERSMKRSYTFNCIKRNNELDFKVNVYDSISFYLSNCLFNYKLQNIYIFKIQIFCKNNYFTY